MSKLYRLTELGEEWVNEPQDLNLDKTFHLVALELGGMTTHELVRQWDEPLSGVEELLEDYMFEGLVEEVNWR